MHKYFVGDIHIAVRKYACFKIDKQIGKLWGMGGGGRQQEEKNTQKH